MKIKIVFQWPGVLTIFLAALTLSVLIHGILDMIGNRNAELRAQIVDESAVLYMRSEESYAELEELWTECMKKTGNHEDCLKAVREALPEGMTMEENIVRWIDREGHHSLLCKVVLEEDGLSWKGIQSADWLRSERTESVMNAGRGAPCQG